MKTALHSGDIGDCIAALPVIRHLGGAELLLCSRPGTKGLSGARYDAIRPLLECQPYIHGVEHCEEAPRVDIDFTDFRSKWGSHPTLIGKQAVEVGVDPAAVDLSPWLTIPDAPRHGKIVLCRSTRYQGFLHWFRLWQRKPQELMFCGFEEEYRAFVYNNNPQGPNARHKQHIPFQPTDNLLELAKIIKGAKLLVCNQGSPLWIGLGLGTTPILMEAVNDDSIIGRANVRVVREMSDNPDVQEWERL